MAQTILYVDPFAAGHRTEHFAFYLRICAALGLHIHACVPTTVWNIAMQQLGTPVPYAQHTAAEISSAAETLSRKIDFLSETAARARRHSADLIFFPTFDPFLLPMTAWLLTGNKFPISWSGVFFADCFSYLAEQIDWPKRFVKSLLKYAAMQIVLRSNIPELLTLNKAWRTKTPVPVTWLPDSISSLDAVAAAKSGNGLWPVPQSPPNDSVRTRFLLFGALQPRKGLTNIATAFLGLTDAELGKVAFHVLGKFDADGIYKSQVTALFAALARRGADVRLEDAYVDNDALDRAVTWCDVVLMPYQGHIGSSGVMNIAAQYGRPVIAQRRYQLGEEVRKYDLGLSIDTSSTSEMVKAIRNTLAGGLAVTAGMRAFREERTPQRAHDVVRDLLIRRLGLTPEKSEARDGMG